MVGNQILSDSFACEVEVNGSVKIIIIIFFVIILMV